MRVSRHLSIDPSPYDPKKVANDIQLAAFFFGKSTAYSAIAYGGISWQLNKSGV